MRRWLAVLASITDHRAATLILSITLGIVVGLLAWLQYRWIGELSQAERARIREGLFEATDRFVAEFNGDIARSLQWLMPGLYRRPYPESLAERLARWADTSPYRPLIAEVYQLRPDKSGATAFERFDESSGEFAPSEWPSALAAIRPAWESLSEEVPSRMFNAGGERLYLFVPPFRRRFPPDLRQPELPGPAIIVEFDRAYLLKRHLPSLVRRYFAADYRVEIAEGRRVIYPTDAPQADSPPPDVTAALFLLPFSPPRDRPEGGPPKGGRAFRPRTRPPPIPGWWQLRVWPSSGPVERIVEAARWRNTALSFAVLGLIGLSTAALVLSAGRARRLASLQMDFVAGVSHELRTPLAVIGSAAENIADGVVTDPMRLRHYGRLIRDEQRRLAEMVEHVLAFAGAQAGQLRREPQPVDIAPVIDEALRAAEPDLKRAGAHAHVQIQPGLPAVMGDPALLVLCLRNLLANAARHSDFAGSIGVTASPGPEPAAVTIAVEDHGAGIDPADLPHIFDPFYRGRHAVQRQVHGAGLGLSLVKRIVEAYNGRIEVASEPGQGSRFVLHLPAAPEILDAPEDTPDRG